MLNSRVEISPRTIIYTISFLVGLWFLVQIRDILFLLFISFLVMTAIHPLVLLLERFRLPRMVSIILIYAILFGFFGVSLVGTIPGLVSQSTKLIQLLPNFVAKIWPYWSSDAATLSQQLAPLGDNIVKFTLSIFSNIVATVTVLVFTFYFLLERRHVEATLAELFGVVAAKRSTDLLRLVERRLGAWVRGELLLMLSIGVFTYIGLTVLHVDFALPLAILAGVLEIVPMIGPIISAIPAVIVALSISPFLALSVGALYFVVQQVENNIIVPMVMRKSVGFPPLVTIISLMVGGRLAGVMGAVLAVPVALTLQVLISEFVLKPNKEDSRGATKNPPPRKS